MQINTSSGFLALSIEGDVELTVPAGEHLQTLALTRRPATSRSRRSSSRSASRQSAPRSSTDDVFSQTLGGSVEADASTSASTTPRTPSRTGEDSTSLTLTATVAELADGIDGGDVTVTADDADRADLLKALNFEPNNPTSLFGGVQAAFESAGSDLTTMTGGGLDVPIPLVGLLGQPAHRCRCQRRRRRDVRTGRHGGHPRHGQHPAAGVPATTTLTDDTPTFTRPSWAARSSSARPPPPSSTRTSHTLTLAPQLGTVPVDDTPYLVENELLGAVHVLTPPRRPRCRRPSPWRRPRSGNGSTIDFGLVDGTGGAQLRLDLTWKREYGVSRPVSLDLGDGQAVVGASAGGELKLDASGTVKLRLLLPLTAAAMLDPIDNTLVDETSSPSSAFNVAARRGRPHRRQRRPGQPSTSGTEDDPGSFNAGFGIQATGTTGEDTPSIADFFSSGFDIGMTNGGADCDDGRPGPLRAPSRPSSPGPAPGDLTVTSTLGDGDDLTDVFSRHQHGRRDPRAGCRSSSTGKPFKFDTLAEGLKQYLFYAETALRVASNNGEMPVVGKDLQAGADFMGDTREKIDAFLEENGDPTTVGGATDLLTTKLADRARRRRQRRHRHAGGLHLPRPCWSRPRPRPARRATPGRGHDAVPLQGRLHLQGRQERRARLASLGPERGRGRTPRPSRPPSSTP